MGWFFDEKEMKRQELRKIDNFMGQRDGVDDNVTVDG